MQTFLPNPFFTESAILLDKKRCWKQVVEAKQILCNLRAEGIPEEWQQSKDYINQKYINHPAVQMWKSYENWLISYYNIFLECCRKKHQINTTLPFIDSGAITHLKNNELTVDWAIGFYNTQIHLNITNEGSKDCGPWWLNEEKFHRSHRARLIEKDRAFYLPQFPKDENFNDGKYWWPDNETKTFKTI